MSRPICPAAGCNKARRSGQVFCREHWYAVPEELRNRIWQTFRKGDIAGNRAAVREAIRFFREGGAL